jgi:hypothetical protein
LWFIISIIDPNKYKKAAKEIISEERRELGLTGAVSDRANFLINFINLEGMIRDFVRQRNLSVPKTTRSNQIMSFRQLIEILYYNELIDREFYDELLQIGKYRNLVVHGELEVVDQAMVDRVQSAQRKLEQLLQNNPPSNA